MLYEVGKIYFMKQTTSDWTDQIKTPCIYRVKSMENERNLEQYFKIVKHVWSCILRENQGVWLYIFYTKTVEIVGIHLIELEKL